MKADFDIAVVGSGFGGSLTAMIARQLGRSVIMIERESHPRFVIGESSTPLASLLLEELAVRYDLPRLLPLTKWGAWRAAYPRIACGLKRGFTFFHHRIGESFTRDPERRNELLVAASPRDEIADTHWYRAEFDHFLVSEAQVMGVEYLDRARLENVSFSGGRVTLDGERDGQGISVGARFVIDATGSRGFLHRSLQLSEAPFENLPTTQALFSHFAGVKRWEDVAGASRNNAGMEGPPYPVEDAAVHHVFDGGWIWVLRFNNGITSAGVAATDELANDLGLAEGASGWSRLLRRLPTLREQFAGTSPQFPFVHTARLPFCSGVVAGPRWALLPSAAGFVDPLLSTGFPLTLLGVSRLSEILETGWDSPGVEQRLTSYAQRTIQELDVAARLVGALYASMNDFSLFTALSLLYFAASTFSETARRLNQPELAGGFLMHDHPRFGPKLRSCCERAAHLRENGGMTAAARAELIDDIFLAIDPIDVTGLGDRSRRNWFPVDARDLFMSAGKLGVGETEIKQLLTRCGFFGA
ncbi:MAG TPA: tryptophan 7-halogenase [Candidatus Angelobacter sp.]|nr:tryptophan 7-halogenase [Candidatus Angelobacter sp.]